MIQNYFTDSVFDSNFSIDPISQSTNWKDAKIILLPETHGNQECMIRNAWIINHLYQEGDLVLIEADQNIPQDELESTNHIALNQIAFVGKKLSIQGWDNLSTFEQIRADFRNENFDGFPMDIYDESLGEEVLHHQFTNSWASRQESLLNKLDYLHRENLNRKIFVVAGALHFFHLNEVISPSLGPFPSEVIEFFDSSTDRLRSSLSNKEFILFNLNATPADWKVKMSVYWDYYTYQVIEFVLKIYLFVKNLICCNSLNQNRQNQYGGNPS